MGIRSRVFGGISPMISQLFPGILKDHVPPDIFIRAEKQARVASSRLKDVGPEEKQ